MITGSLVAHVKTPIGNGTIEVNDRDVILTTKKVLVDKKEKSKIIPIKYIAKVEFKRPGITPGHLKIWYSSGKLMISSYTTMFGAKMEIINITKKEISGFPEIYSYLSERITQYPSSGAKYIGGHPNIADSFIDCFIIIQDDGIVIERIPEYSELFKLPWEKIDSITTDIKSDWKGTNLAAGWLLLGPIGSMLMGKSTQEQLGVVVKGKDGNGDPVKVPIAFDSVKNIVKIKAASDRYMIRTAGISI